MKITPLFQTFLTITVASSWCVDLVHGQFDQFGAQKHCPANTCPKKDETPVPKSPLKFESPGCNSLAGGGVSMGGGAMGNEDAPILPCCDLYYACLQICGSTKSFCDSNLEKCMDRKCNEIQDEDEKKSCEKTVSVKKIMLQLSQCADFHKYQSQNCQCVKDAAEERANVLRQFYKVNQPQNLDKVDSLMAKASDSKKFAGLLYKLVEKYPKGIKRVKDPQQRMMDDLMKNAAGGSFETKEKKMDTHDDDGDEEDDSDERIEL